MKKSFQKVTKDHVLRRTFSYSKDGVNLNFNLRVDVKTELKTFEEILIEALTDIRGEIEK